MATSSSEHLDETSATHHHLVASRRSSTDGTSGEAIDESSLTHHETRHDADDDDFDKLKISDDGDTANKISEQQQRQQKFQKSATAVLNERVAAYATRAYNKAVANSKILKKESLDSEADCNDVAMVKFHELKVGKFLGNGSFSDVQ